MKHNRKSSNKAKKIKANKKVGAGAKIEVPKAKTAPPKNITLVVVSNVIKILDLFAVEKSYSPTVKTKFDTSGFTVDLESLMKNPKVIDQAVSFSEHK